MCIRDRCNRDPKWLPLSHFEQNKPHNFASSSHNNRSQSYNVSWKSLVNFLRNPVHRQADRQTPWWADAGDYITCLVEVITKIYIKGSTMKTFTTARERTTLVSIQHVSGRWFYLLDMNCRPTSVVVIRFGSCRSTSCRSNIQHATVLVVSIQLTTISSNLLALWQKHRQFPREILICFLRIQFCL